MLPATNELQPDSGPALVDPSQASSQPHPDNLRIMPSPKEAQPAAAPPKATVPPALSDMDGEEYELQREAGLIEEAYERFEETRPEPGEEVYGDDPPVDDAERPSSSPSSSSPDTQSKPNAPPVRGPALQAARNSLDLRIFDPDSPVPAERLIYEGFLSEGDLGIWIGTEKHRKTTLVLQLAMSAALGRDFLGLRFAVKGPLRIVIIDYESKAGSLKRRWDAISAAMGLGVSDRQQLKNNLHIIPVREVIRAGVGFPRFPAANPRKDEVPRNTAAGAFWKALVEENPADLYIVDPLRCLHSGDENDSMIESLLASVRSYFGGSAVIITHHMRKSGGSNSSSVTLHGNMREWSDGCRGSGAIKAHADCIICQERRMDEDTGAEIIDWGVFAKDIPDIEPMALVETDAETFFWVPSREIPVRLRDSFDVLKTAGGKFTDKAHAIDLIKKAGISKSAAYRHIGEMLRIGILAQEDGALVLREG